MPCQYNLIKVPSSDQTTKNDYSFANAALKFRLLAADLFGLAVGRRERWSLAYPFESSSDSETSDNIFNMTKFLEEKLSIKSKVVSVPSEGLFRQQSKSYQEEVIPSDVISFGLTAGLPVNLEGLVGRNGKIFGLDHFGYSAPASVLDNKFGFTGENVFNQVKELLNK